MNDEISRQPLPAWHKEVLDERRNLVQKGKLKFFDFETAIADLRKEVRLYWEFGEER